MTAAERMTVEHRRTLAESWDEKGEPTSLLSRVPRALLEGFRHRGLVEGNGPPTAKAPLAFPRLTAAGREMRQQAVDVPPGHELRRLHGLRTDSSDEALLEAARRRDYTYGVTANALDSLRSDLVELVDKHCPRRPE